MAMTADSSRQKLFGRYDELALLLLGFVFTTLVCGFLTYWYQTRAWERQDLSNRKQEEMWQTMLFSIT
jgi:hypothetical protein